MRDENMKTRMNLNEWINCMKMEKSEIELNEKLCYRQLGLGAFGVVALKLS